MSPQPAHLLYFPGRALRQLLISSLLPRVLAIAILPGLLCGPAFAATHIASLSVSATVVSGCRVSAALSSADRTASAPNALTVPVSVNCSLPVAYQVAVSSSQHTELASLSSTSPVLAGLPGYARTRDLDSLQTAPVDGPIAEPIRVTMEPDYGLTGLAASGLPAPSEGANRPADALVAAPITVTIVY